jgi:LruC domain-containing protein
MKNLRQTYTSLLVLMILLASCKPDPIIITPDESMKDLVVPSGFVFDLNKSVTISVKLPRTIDYSAANRIIEIWDEKADGQPSRIIKTACADNTGNYSECITMPVTTKKIFTHCFAGWRTVSLTDTLFQNPDRVFRIDYTLGYQSTLPQFCEVSHVATTNAVKTVKNPPALLSGNKVTNGDFSLLTFGKMESWWFPMEADSTWYASDSARNLVSIKAEEGNTFARITGTSFITGGISQLVPATEGQIVTFSADTRGFDSQQDIHLFLLPRNLNGENFEIFSYELVNSGVDWTNCSVVATMPKGTATCQVLFYSAATGIVDFDNAVVTINDANADIDGDGVPNYEDLYPDDPKQAFHDTYPAKDKPGTLAFEDSWPNVDDYDFNDLIVDYQIRRVCNSANKVIEIDFISQVRAIGTTNKNGFGFQIYISPDKVAGVGNDFSFSDESVKLNENGTEMGQQWATFIFFNDAGKAFTHIQEGSPTINTTMGYYFVVPLEYKFRIYLKEAIDPQEAGCTRINPFLYKTAERSREIHLPGYPPTDLANTSLFGTGSDASTAGSGPWFQTKNGVPWVLSLPVMFDYPIEKSDLLTSHLVFSKWASSGGTKNQDWYLDKAGYRNWDKVYRW